MRIKALFSVIIIASLFSCDSNTIPKPRGYFRIDLPDKQYLELKDNYPFSFLYPNYASISAYDGKPGEEEDVSNWLNIDFPEYKAHFYLTYKDVRENLGQLIDDSHNFVYKHIAKAEAISQTEYINDESRVYGVLFDIKGNTATSVQFYLTDSVSGFLRGALYFDCEPNQDSLAPLIDFFKQDLEVLIESFSWK